MSTARRFWVCLSWILLWANVQGVEAPLRRPVPDKGVEARTLLVYTDTRTPYSLADGVVALKLQLRRFNMKLETVPVSEFDSNKLAAADYVVVFCPQPFPPLTEELCQAVAAGKRPILWVGYGADQLEQLPPFEGQFSVTPFAATNAADRINYRGREWNEPLSLWLLTQVNSNAASSVLMTTPVEENGQTVEHPISWKTGPVTFFAALPVSTANCALFGDLLLDFFGVNQVLPSMVGVRIDGYHCRQDHREFRHLVDYLYAHKHPFMVGVIPAFWDPEKKQVLDLDSQPEFVAALRYAQKRGGRLVVQGYVHARKDRTVAEPEFWDSVLDRPLAEDSPEYVRERVYRGVRQMLKHGLFPLAWQTPYYSASRADYAEIAAHFSTAVERVQLSDATSRETFAPTACTVDDLGRVIVPENLGLITGQRGTTLRIQSRAEVLAQLRGTVALCSFPAYLTDDKLIQMTAVLEQLNTPFLDLAEGDHWVQLPDVLLLTGNAERTATLRDARIRWKAFDRTGKLLAEELETQTASGERTFKRRGAGDYELFEINEVKP
jgi:uncharacterized protein YdaL